MVVARHVQLLSPDSGVAEALQSVQKNNKFKRLLIFGLKSLSDFCTPNVLKWKENSLLVAKTSEGFAQLLQISKVFKGDDEVAGFLGKVYSGVAAAIQVTSDEALLKQLEVAGFSKTLVEAIVTINDDSVLMLYLKTIKNIEASGVQVDMAALGPVLLKSLNPRISIDALNTILSSVESSAKNPQIAATLDAEKVMRSVANRHDCAQAIIYALNICKLITANTKSMNSTLLTLVVEVLSNHKDSEKIQEAGSAVLAQLISTDSLKNCLDVLKKSSPDDPNRDVALSMLGSMSFISSYAGQIAAAGGVSSLLEALDHSVKALESGKSDQTGMKGIVGVCKMLASIARQPGFEPQEIVQLNGPNSLMTAIQLAADRKDIAAFDASVDALTPLLKIEEVAKMAISRNVPTTVSRGFFAMKSSAKEGLSLNLTSGVIEMFQKLGSHGTCVRALVCKEVAEIITVCTPSYCKDKASLYSAVLCLAELLFTASASLPGGCEPLAGCVKVITEIMAHSVSNKDLILQNLAVLKGMSNPQNGLKSGANGQMLSGYLVDAALTIMLEAPESLPQAAARAKEILEDLATEADVFKCLTDFSSTMNNASQKPAICLRALAGVNGLAHISRLRPIFDRKDATSILMQGIQKLVEAPTCFDLQQKIIRAAAQSIESLATTGEGTVDDLAGKVVETIQSAAAKSLKDKQILGMSTSTTGGTHVKNAGLDVVGENSLTDLCSLFERLCGTQRFKDKGSVLTLLDQTLRVMRKYPDIRKVQCSCIKTVDSLTRVDVKQFSAKVIETGLLRTIIAYMSKVQIYVDVQEVGTTLMLNLAKQSDKVVDNLKSSSGGTDIPELLRKLITVHPKSSLISSNVRQLLAILIPSEEIDKAIRREIQLIDENLNMLTSTSEGKSVSERIDKINKSLDAINTMTISIPGAKIGVKCGLGRLLESAVQKLGKQQGSAPGQLEVYSRLGVLAQNITQTPPGVAQVIKHGGVALLIEMFETLKKGEDAEGMEATMKAMQRLLQKDRNQAEICYQKGWGPSICNFAIEYEKKSEACHSAAVACIAAMKPNKEMINNPDFKRYIQNLCSKLLECDDLEKKGLYVDALEAILLDPSDEVMDIVVKSHGLKALLHAQEDLLKDSPRIRKIQKCIDQISQKHNLRTAFRKMDANPDVPIERMAKSTRKVLKELSHEPDICIMSLRNTNKIVTADDKRILAEFSLIPEIENLLALYPGNDELMKVCGEYLSKMGGDEQILSLMKKIIDLAEHQPANYLADIVVLENKLAVYLAGELKDDDHSLKLTQQCVDCLAELINKHKTNIPLLTATLNVTKRIARRSILKPDTPYGISTLKTKMMRQIAEACAKDSNPDLHMRKRSAYINGFQTLTDILKHAPTRNACIADVKQFKTIDHAVDIVLNPPDDPELVQAALDFLATLALNPAMANQLLSDYSVEKGTRKVPHGDLCESILANLKKFGRNPGVVEAGFDLLGNLGCHEKQLPLNVLSNPQFLGDPGDGNDDAKFFTSNLNMQRKLIGKVPKEVTQSIVQKANDTYLRIAADPNVPEGDKMEAQAALALFLAALAENGLMADVKKAGLLNTVIEMWENLGAKELANNKRLLKNLKVVGDNDAEANGRIAKSLAQVLLPEFADVMRGDYEGMMDTLHLLKTVAGTEGNGRALAAIEGYKKLLDHVQNMDCEMTEFEAEEMNLLVEQVRQLVDDDQPELLSLRVVYGKWLASSEALHIGESAVVGKYWDYVQNYTEEYSKEPIDSLESEIGAEYQAGCQCYMLLHQLEANSGLCREGSDEAGVFLSAMAKQRHEHACQAAVRVAKDALQWADAPAAWAATANAAAIAAEVLQKGRKLPGSVEPSAREGMLMERLIVVERLSQGRTFYNGTDCMAALIGLWDDVDGGKYSSLLLKQVFKTMRQIVNDHWVGIVLKNSVPKRLVAFVLDKKSRLDLLPDVLFLISVLAVVKEIKDLLGELGAVEAVLDLLSRSLKLQTQLGGGSTPSPKSSGGSPSSGAGYQPSYADLPPVQTNACLALSALTLSHTENLKKFLASKGLELNVEIMDRSITGTRSIEYDVANAASLLMCNTCFKRDSMKEAYGKRDACRSVMKIINMYDGKEDVKAFRCLGTMFKAIGNLALHQDNVTSFMEGRIDQVFVDLYMKSDRLPDELMSASLRTLSNLTLENTEENMIRFGKCLSPILFVLNQDKRASVTMFALALDVLASLCRHPNNATDFMRKEGIPTCLKILNTYNDKHLYVNGIKVLGIQTTAREAVSELIRHGVFDFLSSSLANQSAAAGGGGGEDSNGVDQELATLTLRCIRRLLPTKEAAQEFINANGLEEVRGFMENCPNELSMCHMDCHRVLLNCLVLFPPPPEPPKVPTNRQSAATADEWDDVGEIPDEGVRPAVESIDRPMGPRSWESVKLDAKGIRSLIQSLWKILDREKNLEQPRLIRTTIGLLAYFAVEKIPDTVDVHFASNFTPLLKELFKKWEGNEEIVKSGCYILNNVAYASEPELYSDLRKDRDMRKALDFAAGQQKGAAKMFCDLTLKLLNDKSNDPSRFSIHQQWSYPLEWTWWDKDKYPMGVQDLPDEMKQNLRVGGKYKMFLGGEREVFSWRASPDLTQFIWREKENGVEQRVEIARIGNISKGLASADLRQAHERGSPTSKPREYECLVLSAPPNENYPNGVELSLACGLKRSRDTFFSLLVEWREAAAFGFQ